MEFGKCRFHTAGWRAYCFTTDGYRIINVRTNVGACCTHEGEAGTTKSAQEVLGGTEELHTGEKKPVNGGERQFEQTKWRETGTGADCLVCPLLPISVSSLVTATSRLRVARVHRESPYEGPTANNRVSFARFPRSRPPIFFS